MLVALANDLVLMFVGLELISIPTYVILYLGRGENLLESGTKYFFLSVLSSALLLYGFSFLYGAAGSTRPGRNSPSAGRRGSETGGVTAFAPLALVLIFAGLAFRLTAVPFHFYAPDVYQGTTNPNAGLLAVVPKIAGLVVLVRIASWPCRASSELGWQLSLAVAMVTMTLGNLLALWQRQRAPAAGLFVDRACRLHADRPGGRLCGGRPAPSEPSISTASARRSSICWSTRRRRPARSPR